MPLRKRPIDRFNLISTQDEAFDSLSEDVVNAYAESNRDWDVIAPHVEKMNPKPIIFSCDPLKPAYDANALTGAVADLKAISAAHVKGMENAPEELRPVLIRDGERTFLDVAYVDSLPLAWVIDVAGAIVSRGVGDTTPFSLPDGFWRRRTRRLVMRHAAQIGQAVHSTTIASGDSGNNAPRPTASNPE